MSSIYYSLTNGNSFETFSFDKDEIKLSEFRNAIIGKEFVGKLDCNELDIIDFNSRKKYAEEETLKKNAYVIISKVPKIVLMSAMNKNSSEMMKTTHQVATIQPYSVDQGLVNAENKNKIAETNIQKNIHQTENEISDESNKPLEENVQYYTYCYVDQQEADALKNIPANSNLPFPPMSCPFPRPPIMGYQQSGVMFPEYCHPSSDLYPSHASTLAPFMGPPLPYIQSYVPPPIPSHLHTFPLQQSYHHPFQMPSPVVFPNDPFYRGNHGKINHHRGYDSPDDKQLKTMRKFHHCDERDGGKEKINHRYRKHYRASPLSKRNYMDDKYSRRYRSHRYNYSSDEEYHRSKSRERMSGSYRKEEKIRKRRSRSREHHRAQKTRTRDSESHRRPRSESYDSDDIIKINNGIDITSEKKRNKSSKNQSEKALTSAEKIMFSSKDSKISTLKEDSDCVKNRLNDAHNLLKSSKLKSVGRRVSVDVNEKQQSSEECDEYQDTSSSPSTPASSEDEMKIDKLKTSSSKVNKKVISVVTVTSKRKTVSNQLSPNIS